MSLSITYTRAQKGVDAPLVTVETHLSNGLPGFTIVGLPETAVKESKDRVRSAILNSHFEFPQRRITVNLAPADLPKEGGRYDLAIAIGILAASEQVPLSRLCHFEFLGELALSGDIRPIKGVLSGALACGTAKRTLIIPSANGAEAALCPKEPGLVADNLLQVCAHLHERQALDSPIVKMPTATLRGSKDLKDVKGQALARRALEVAAAGGHNLLFFGPPGTGKSMLASRLPSILPTLNDDEAVEIATLRSLVGEDIASQWRVRPFRSPHHTASAIALVGGGANPKPGEISLAHRGVLFLDELPEYTRSVLEVLREPLETGEIHISRARASTRFPAQFQLVAAMNPCPCGYYGDKRGQCRCTPQQIEQYKNRISGPLLDRIDMHVQVSAIPVSDLQDASDGETSETVQARVESCRQQQLSRQGKANAHLQPEELRDLCFLDQEPKQLLTLAMTKLNLSARAYNRVLKVARTLADMAGEGKIGAAHVSEALSYRMLDRSPL